MCGSKIHYRGDPFFFFVFAHATTHIPPPLFCFHIQPNARIETIQQHQCFVLTKIKISVDAHAEPFAGRVGTPTTQTLVILYPHPPAQEGNRDPF